MANEALREKIDNAVSKLGDSDNALRRAYARSQYRIGESPNEVGRLG